MTRKGPLITLLGGGALAAVLLAASINATGGEDENPEPAAGAGAAPPTSAAPEPSAAPESEAPGQEPAEEDPDALPYVGSVDGGGASVAIIVSGDQATAYVCDGDTVEAWLEGPASNGELVLEGDDSELIGSFDPQEASGAVTVGEIEFTFTVELVEPPAGLYAVADTIIGGAEVEAGWVILPDGTQIGITLIDGEQSPAPEIDLDTGEVELNGEVVTAEPVTGWGD